MKVKVFQVFKKIFDKEGNLIPKELRTYKTLCIGTVIVPKNKKYIKDSIWDLFNWICWWNSKKSNIYLKGIRKGFRKDGYRCFPNSNAKGFCNSDIFFKLNDKWVVAKPFGWDKVNSYEESIKNIISRDS